MGRGGRGVAICRLGVGGGWCWCWCGSGVGVCGGVGGGAAGGAFGVGGFGGGVGFGVCGVVVVEECVAELLEVFEGGFECGVEGAEAAALFLGGVVGTCEGDGDVFGFEDELEVGTLRAEVGVLVDGAAEGLGGVVVEDGEEDGEGELELGVEGVEWCVLEEEEGLDLVEEGLGEGLVWGVVLGGGGGVRVWHVHSTFVLGWGVVE